jgi:hypothetical protein
MREVWEMALLETKTMWRHKTHVAIGIAVVGVALLGGCYTQIKTARVEDTVPPETSLVILEDLTVETDHPWYDRSPSGRYVTIRAVLENHGRKGVFVSGCPYPPSYVIEKWDDGVWEEDVTYGVACTGFQSTKTVRLRPGESLEFDAHAKFPGWYRICVLVGRKNEHPIGVAYSSQFLVK